MPKLRQDYEREREAKDLRSRSFKKSRLPVLIKEACDAAGEDKSGILGRGYKTVIERSRYPGALTLDELAHFYLYAQGTQDISEDYIIEYVGMYIEEQAKDLKRKQKLK